MYVRGDQTKDFGAKNVALIALFAVILGSLAWSQRPSRAVSAQAGLSFNKQNTNVYAQDNSNQSEVLGAATVNQQLLDQFASIPVKVSADTSKDALQIYAGQIATIKQADTGRPGIIDHLSSLAVPEVLVDYHRLTLAYYNLEFNAVLSQTDAQNVQILQEAISQQLTEIRSNFLKSTGISLP
jgi:hypothetical protein